MLDFRMDTFLMVCETMIYARRGTAQYYPAAVSQHIRFLEDYYGAKLFAYQGKKMEITEAGSALQSAGLTMKHDVMSLKEEMGGLGDGKAFVSGVTLTVGNL